MSYLIVCVLVHFHSDFQSLTYCQSGLLYSASMEFLEFHLVEAQLKMELAEMVCYLREEVSCWTNRVDAVSDLGSQSITTLLLVSDASLSLWTHEAFSDVMMILGLEVSFLAIMKFVGFCSFCLSVVVFHLVLLLEVLMGS